MTVASELKIDVQSEEFDKFRKAFDAYNAALEGMPATWRGVATQAAVAKTAFEASANAFAVQVTAAHDATVHVTKLTQTSGALARHWHEMRLSTSGVATHIKDMTVSLQSWAGTLGKLALGGAGIAGLGFWGMEAMGRGVMGKRMQAGGFGIGIGGLQSFQTNYARLGSTDEMLSGATTAKSNISSTERRALINLGISNSDIDRLPADDLAALEVRKFKEFSNSIKDDSLFYTRADALGVPLSHETMQRIRGTSGEELGAIENQRVADKPKMDIPPATARKWTDFSNAVAETAATLKNKFEVRLSDLASPLSKLSTGVGKLADEFIDKDLGPWIDGLATGLDSMTKAVGTDEAKGAMTGFIADVKAMTQGTIGLVHGLASAARWLGIATPAAASTLEAAGKTSAPFGMGPLQAGQAWPAQPGSGRGGEPPLTGARGGHGGRHGVGGGDRGGTGSGLSRQNTGMATDAMNYLMAHGSRRIPHYCGML